MNLVIDTSVWSLVLRRPRVDETHPLVRTLRVHIESNDTIFLVGSILQELLDGLRDRKDFHRLLSFLEPFPLLALERETYVAAAEIRQRCRSHGIQVSGIDCLIAAACMQHRCPLLTADRDFARIAEHSDLVLLGT